MVKNKGGRPRIELTDEQIIELEDLAKGMTHEQIAAYFGIGERTFYEIKNRVPAVEAAYKKGKAKGIEKAISLLWEKMNDKDSACIMFYLKTQAGWKEKQDLNISSDDGSLKVPSPVLISFSDDTKKD